MAKDKYQISLWEDVVVGLNTSNEHFEESKLCDIGADDMTSTCRAYEPQLIENINGTNTFKFKMYYVYRDDGGEGELLQNPYLNLLVNERRVKVLWKDKWYDFVIKDIAEDSGGKSITYTCTDLFINELSKNGFNIEFDTELENNQGTAVELARATLDGTDWQLDETNSDIIQQEVEEPVYEVNTVNSWTVFNQTSGSNITIPSGVLILVYYNQIQDLINASASSGTCSLQIAYSSTGYTTDSKTSMLVTNASCCKSISTVDWTKTSTVLTFKISNSTKFTLTYTAGVSNNYRANRLVESQQTILDPLTDKYVKIYKATANGTGEYSGAYSTNDIIYGYQATEYKDPTFVSNLIVNGSNFSGLDGWVGTGGPWVLYPPYTQSNNLSTYEAKSYLRLGTRSSTSGSYYIYNDGIHNSLSYLKDGFAVGDYYIFRCKIMEGTATSPNGKYCTATYSSRGIDPIIYEANDNKQPINSAYFEAKSVTNAGNNWIEFRLRCKKSASRTEISSKKISIFIAMRNEKIGTRYLWLEEAEFFPEIYGVVGSTRTRINPGEMSVQSIATVVNKFYNHTKNSGLINTESLKYIYIGENTSLPNVEPVVHEDYVKIRSINIKQSNRFNILQTIAETFECWIRFNIQHDQETGRIIYVDGVPQKKVAIKKEIGQETGIGFIYGLDLKTIQRAIKSSDIVTKTIVSPNNNEYATDGFCTIARSEENYPRETFILDFGYYITHGLLNGGLLNRDLYLSTGGLAYYYKLNQWNTQYDASISNYANKQTELNKQESYETVYNEYLTALQTEKGNLESDIMKLSNTSSMSAATAYAKKHPDYTDLITKINARTTCINNISAYQKILTQLRTSITALKATLESLKTEQETIINNLKELHAQFYQKYSRYIQEGSWTSEEYIDDNLYYLDAKSVAYTSSRPQVSYNISVFRISAIEDFEGRVFKLGDITFIQDTEFFGYVFINGVKTPYKEKVLVSEVTSYFDSPEKDTFKVQNYKTQFEDLFQRITATTQSLQYASGEYARAASAIEPDGTINPETLQSSLELNAQLVYSARNNAIVQDSTGITVTDASNPAYKTKITSGGVFITTDGGITWKNAVRGEGIATQYLTAGSINTENISILDGAAKTFKWDSQGISAYARFAEEGTDTSTYTRFDRYGIYGISELEDFKPTSEASIWDNANFALTWRGFMLNNQEGNGHLSITTDNDIQVFGPPAPDSNSTEEVERIKIGRLYMSNNLSGYTLVTADAPTQGTQYYVYNSESGGYIKDNLIYFNSDTIYFEDVDGVKIITYDVRPRLNKSYYLPSTYVVRNPIRSFDDGVTYFEASNDSYIPTSDTTPIYHKLYYLPVDPYIALTDLETFESGITYYELDENGDYIETLDESPVEGKVYYVTADEMPDGTTFVLADIPYYFEEDYYYYLKDTENDEYILVTDSIPSVDATYYTPGTWTQVTFTRSFQPGTSYYTRDEMVYGIRINDNTGTPVLEQNGDGQLWLRDRLHISSTPFDNTGYSIRLGYLPEAAQADQIWTTNFGTAIDLDTRQIQGASASTYNKRTFDVNNKFIVWEDGVFYASGGYFEGTINATGGKIGNMSIADIGAALYRVIIESDNGTVFKNGEGSTTLRAYLYSGESAITSGLSYQWYVGSGASMSAISGATSSTLYVQATASDDIYNYSCQIIY